MAQADVFLVGRRRAKDWLDAAASAQVQTGPWQVPVIPPSGPPTGKAIVICCDGTANDPKQMEGELAAPTNVYRLYEALTDDTQFGTSQITWYDPGVGTGTSKTARRAGWLARIAGKIGDVLPDWIPVATDRALKALEGATGIWIEENIAQGYREIVRNYEPGDRIYIFGFSRGAYTARCIAGVIQRCGLLLPENIRFTGDAITLYRRRKNNAVAPLLKPDLIHPPETIRIHVLGLWDTVASLGLPLWGWWFRLGAFWRNKNLDTNPAAICEHVYHAMSMDEQRSQFFPTVTTPDPAIPPVEQTIRQIWFRGAHADIGGGYASRSLGDIGLEWMLQIAHHHGLKIREDIESIQFVPAPGGLGDLPAPGDLPAHGDLLVPGDLSVHGALSVPGDLPICPKADPMGKMHDEIKSQPSWIYFGSWPRWAPVPRPGWSDAFQEACITRFGLPHFLVYRRALLAVTLWQRRKQHDAIAPEIDASLARDGLVFLAIGQKLRVKISARTVWNRTGIVFESAALYRVAYIAGTWSDAEKRACGPAGQQDAGVDLGRHLIGHGLRLPGADRMQLIGHVAHPRPWRVAEFGFRMLLKLLFRRDPVPMCKSLLPLGRKMGKPADETYILNLAHGGLFYLFANDAWAAYRDNSGAIELEIERVERIPPGADFYTVTPRGEVVPKDDTPEDLRTLVERRSTAIREDGLQKTWPDLSPSDLSPPDISPHFATGTLMQLGDELAFMAGDAGGDSHAPALSAGGEAVMAAPSLTTEAMAAAPASPTAIDIDPELIAFPDALGGLSRKSIGLAHPAPDITELDAELAARLDALAASARAAGEGTAPGDRRGFARRRAAGRYLRSPWSADWTREES